jgi:hypothetical protein
MPDDLIYHMPAKHYYFRCWKISYSSITKFHFLNKKYRWKCFDRKKCKHNVLIMYHNNSDLVRNCKTKTKLEKIIYHSICNVLGMTQVKIWVRPQRTILRAPGFTSGLYEVHVIHKLSVLCFCLYIIKHSLSCARNYLCLFWIALVIF